MTSAFAPAPQSRLGVAAAWIALCLIWSSTWLAIKVGLSDLPPISFCALRFVIAAIFLFALCWRRFPLPREAADYRLLAFTGILMFSINYGLLFWGEQHVSSGLAAILQATIPSFGLLFAHFMLPAEPMRWQRMAGALLALAGVAVICAKLLDFSGVMAFWGGVAIVTGAASAAYANVLIKAHPRQLAPAVMAAWQMLFALVPLLLFGFSREGSPLHFHWSKTAVICLLYLAFVGSVLAFLLYYWLLNRIAVTNALTISLLTPPLAVVFGRVTIGETLTLWALLGAALILSGVALIFWKSANGLLPAHKSPDNEGREQCRR